MSDKKAESALQRWSELEQDQRSWLNLWQEIADYVQPRKGNIAFKRSSAQQQTEKLMDSTAPHANELLAASMQGALTSSAFRWFSLAIRDVDLKENHPIAIELQNCSDDMFAAFNESNHSSETHEVYLDGPCFGTAAILAEERRPTLNVPGGALRFTALPPGSFAIDENDEGMVDTVFRKFSLSARAAVSAFSEGKITKVGAQVQAALKTNANQRFDFLHCIYPRTDNAIPLGHALPATKKPYGSVWVDMVGRVMVRESGYEELPIMVPRWTKTSGEIYGRGPGIIALPDIKTLNKAVELKLKAWAKAVDPPIMVRDEGVVGQVKFRSAGITYVRDMDSIKPLTELSGNMQVADMEEEKLRQSIRRMFYSDQLQLQEGPQMTAYEVQVRYELMQRILGPTLGRLQVEYLNPLINRVFWIRLRSSAKDSSYRKVQDWCKANNKALDVEYEGPLAKAQRLAESTAMQRYFQIVLPLVQAKPDILDNVDLDFVAREHAESVGTPAKMLRATADVAKIRNARAKAEQQQQALNATATTAQAAGQVAPLVKALSGAKEGTIPQGQPVLTNG